MAVITWVPLWSMISESRLILRYNQTHWIWMAWALGRWYTKTSSMMKPLPWRRGWTLHGSSRIIWPFMVWRKLR